MAAELIQNVGQAAKDFMAGFQQSSQEKKQQDIEDEQRTYQHINMLSQMLDRVNNPNEKDAIQNSILNLSHTLDAGPQKPKAGGLREHLGTLFGFGSKPKDLPAPSQYQTPLGPTLPPVPTAPDAVAENSNTYGNIGGMFGAELQQPAVTREKAGGPAVPTRLPDLPSALQFNTPAEQDSIMRGDPLPSINQPRGVLPSTPGPEVVPPPIAQQMPVPQRDPQPAGLSLPTAAHIIEEARQEASQRFGVGQQYQQQDLMGRLAKQKADANARKLLDITEGHLRENGHLRTLVDASNDPTYGADFSHVMSTIAEYERRGLLDKGTLADWQKRTFQDSKQFDPDPSVQTETRADGSVWHRVPGTTDWVQAGGPKSPAVLSPVEKLQEAWNAGDAGTPDQKAIVANDKAHIEAKRREANPLTQDEIAKEEYYKTIGTPEEPAARAKLKSYMDVAHPPAPGQPIVFQGRDPITNQGTASFVSKDGTIKQINIPTRGVEFTKTGLVKMVPVTIPSTIPGQPPINTGKNKEVMDVDAWIRAHQNGDGRVSLDGLKALRDNDEDMTEAERSKLTKYIDSLNPYGK